MSNLKDQYELSEEKIEDLLKQLKNKGLIFEPVNGYLKIV
jgi:replicative DNA helicase Mcm